MPNLPNINESWQELDLVPDPLSHINDNRIRDDVVRFRLENGFEPDHIVASPRTISHLMSVYCREYRIVEPANTIYGMVPVPKNRYRDGVYILV